MESHPSLLSLLPASARLNKTVRILNRYILREVLTHAAIGGVVFTFVLFMRNVTQILELVLRSSSPIPSVAGLIFLTIPSALTFTIPHAQLDRLLLALHPNAPYNHTTAQSSTRLR